MEKNDEQFHIYIFSYTYHEQHDWLPTHANTDGHKKEDEFTVYVSHSNMGNVRYTKSDCEGARSVGERLVFAVHPVGHIAAQHNIGCLYKAAESVQTTSGPPCCHGVAEAMGAGAMATGRERRHRRRRPTNLGWVERRRRRARFATS